MPSGPPSAFLATTYPDIATLRNSQSPCDVTTLTNLTMTTFSFIHNTNTLTYPNMPTLHKQHLAQAHHDVIFIHKYHQHHDLPQYGLSTPSGRSQHIDLPHYDVIFIHK